MIKDFNQIIKYRWLRSPIISCNGPFIEVCGLIKKKQHQLEFIQEWCFRIEPIAYLNGKVIHWSSDCSKCFTYENGKSIEYKGLFSAITE